MRTLSDLLRCVSSVIAPMFHAVAVTTRYRLEVRTFNTSYLSCNETDQQRDVGIK